jgi:hypothetical protein
VKRFFPKGQALSRRAVLRGLVRGTLVSLALPPLEAMFDANGLAYACDGVLPVRFGLFFWGNGNLPDRWTPTDEGSLWTLSDQLQPLDGLQHLITVVTGLEVKHPNTLPHGTGCAGILTAAPLSDLADSGSFSGPSIDQIIAAEIGGETVYRSIESAAHSGNLGWSFNGPNSRNPPEASPLALYERLFGDTFREPGEDAEPDASLGLRRSVLDGVLNDMNRLQAQVGTADQQRLEQHFDGVRDLETRLARLEEDPPELAACTRPGSPEDSYPDVDGRPQLSAISRVNCDLLTMALACDQTRVFSHWFTDPVSDLLFPGATAGHHELTHNEGGDQPGVHDITLQCVAEFAYLVSALDSVAEGDGTLLDNCAVLATSEVSLGQTHAIDEMPVIIAGSACGRLQQGLHIRERQENATRLLLTLIRAMGINQSSLGVDEAQETQGLSAVEI